MSHFKFNIGDKVIIVEGGYQCYSAKFTNTESRFNLGIIGTITNRKVNNNINWYELYLDDLKYIYGNWLTEDGLALRFDFNEYNKLIKSFDETIKV